MITPAAGGKAEVHLFVLWQNARPWADQIIADIETTFRILDVEGETVIIFLESGPSTTDLAAVNSALGPVIDSFRFTHAK